MNKNEKQPFQMKGKGAAVGIVICFVAVIVMVGTYTFSNYQKKLDNQLAKTKELEQSIAKEESEETTADEIVLPKNDDPETVTEDTTEENTTGTESTVTDGAATQVYFSEDSLLAWPASGNILLNYSMDKTVYFSTLDQYKYNPALIISGEVGETICASAAGTVKAIEQSAQTGLTVTLDMGNGYEAIYGQLKEISVSEGEYVGAGGQIGYLSEPTKYYTVEGPNLYFEVKKDEAPVNPMEYME